MNETRYIYKTVPITPEEANLQRLKKIELIELEIDSLRQDLMEKLCESPLPTTKQVQMELNPGDDGYENAPISFNPLFYQGNIRWINQTASPTPSETE
jgi:hypothetical protein